MTFAIETLATWRGADVVISGTAIGERVEFNMATSGFKDGGKVRWLSTGVMIAMPDQKTT